MIGLSVKFIVCSLTLLVVTLVPPCALLADEPPPLPTEACELPYKYVGNSFSSKFHRPSCPFAKAMNIHHIQLFHFRREAVEAGMKPCNYCLPPSWVSVKATIKASSSDATNASEPDDAR